MKKVFIVLMIVLFAATSLAADLKSVGNTTDAAITAGSGYLKGIIVHSDGTNSVTFAVYDNATAASGSKLFSTWTVTTSAANRTAAIGFNDQECGFVNGMYVDITTSGTVTYDVYFKSN
jgi:hypothetical protein